MSFSPNKFLTHISKHGDLAQPSKFRVRILPKRNSRLITPDISRGLELQCDSTELPGFSIDALESKIFGPGWFVATTATFNELTLNFVCAQDMWEKKFFDDWMHKIIPIGQYMNETSPFVEYFDNYTCYVFIEQMTTFDEDKAIYSVVLHDAFPTGITPLNVNWGDSDGVHRLAVNFRYTKWKRADSKTMTSINQFQTPTVSI